jgi:hypothetical protein
LCTYIYIACAGCTPVPVPHATGAYAHPVRILAADGGVGAVVGLGDGKNVGVAVVGVAVAGAAVVIAATQIDLPTVGMTRIQPRVPRRGTQQRSGTVEYIE